MIKRWCPIQGRYVYDNPTTLDTPELIPPAPEDLAITLADRLRARFHMARYNHPGLADDLYLLDAGDVMPLIEKLIAVAAVAEQLLNCSAEFAKDITCCAEYFQAADDKVHTLKAEVGLP